MHDSTNPYQSPRPLDYGGPIPSAVLVEQSWDEVPIWRRGYVCFAALLTMLAITVVAYATPALAPLSLLLSGAGLAYCTLLSSVVVYHAPLEIDDRLRAWEPIEKGAALSLSVIFFSLNAFFAWSYVDDRYLAPLPSGEAPRTYRAVSA